MVVANEQGGKEEILETEENKNDWPVLFLFRPIHGPPCLCTFQAGFEHFCLLLCCRRINRLASSVGRQTGTGSTPACAHMEIKPVLGMLGSGNKIVRADAGLASGRQHIDNPAYCMTSASSHVLNSSAKLLR